MNSLLRSAMMAGLAVLAPSLFSQEIPKPIQESIARADKAIAAIVAVPDKSRTFANTVGAIDDLIDRLQTETSLFVFLSNVSPDAQTRDAARIADEAISNYSIGVGKREDLYKAVKAYADTHPKLSGEQARFLEFTLRDYRRAGMGLSKAERTESLNLEQEIARLSIQFNKNVADDETTLTFTKEELRGVPDKQLAGWPTSGNLYLIPLGESSFNAVNTYAKSEMTRKKAWLAYKRRGGQRNVEVLEKIIKLRDRDAKILGYASTAAFETEVKMAKTPETVLKFYSDLKPIVRKKSLADYQEFLALKREITKNPKVNIYPWDQLYLKNLIQQRKYSVDGSKVSEYFPMEKVVQGLFGVTQSLYGITYKDVTAGGGHDGNKLWHPDVKYYEVVDTATNKTLGHFYLDLYPRPNKYSHAACWSLVNRKVLADGSVQLPVAALVCNFAKPSADAPSLLPHDEVVTFFHEFGHCLHNLLTEATMSRFAGASVEQDFVEAPSQMFENWVWNKDVLKTFARHYKTNEPMPESLLKGMLAARNLGSGLEAEHQFYYGVVDMKYHTAPNGEVDTTKVALDTMGEVELYKGVPGSLFQASFTHLVGYQAGYYAYQWSLVYAQDMFQRFEELGLLSPKAGAYYREKILSKGGTLDATEMLKSYLGREPKLDAFLRHLGMSK